MAVAGDDRQTGRPWSQESGVGRPAEPSASPAPLSSPLVPAPSAAATVAAPVSAALAAATRPQQSPSSAAGRCPAAVPQLAAAAVERPAAASPGKRNISCVSVCVCGVFVDSARVWW